MWSHYSSSFKVFPVDTEFIPVDTGASFNASGVTWGAWRQPREIRASATGVGIEWRIRTSSASAPWKCPEIGWRSQGPLWEPLGKNGQNMAKYGKMRALNLMDANGNFAHQDLRPAVRCSYRECCEKKHKEYSARGICLNCQRLRIVKVNRTLWLCGWQIPSCPFKTCKAYHVTPQFRHLRRSGKLGIHWDAGPTTGVGHVNKPRFTWCLRLFGLRIDLSRMFAATFWSCQRNYLVFDLLHGT